MTEQARRPLFKVTGLWLRESRDGGVMLSGALGGLKLLILPNRDKQDENDPTHVLLVTERTPAAERTTPHAPW